MKKTVIAQFVLLTAVWTHGGRAATVEAMSSQTDPWLRPNQNFSFRLLENDGSVGGSLVFFIDSKDVSALVQQSGIDQYTYDAAALPLPSGEHVFKVYAVDGRNQWQSIGELPIKVLTNSGFEESSLTTRLDLTEKSQFSNQASGDAFAADPETYHNMAMSSGINTHHTRNGWEWRSNWNVVGASVKEEALRFGELQQNAPKTDLSDYLLEVQKGNGRLSVGHVSFGNNPLLISGLANRGFVGSYKAFNRLDLALTSQSGQTITGYNNFFGAKNFATNSIHAGSIGYDFINGENGRLRAELSYLSAEVTSALNFNVGEVADSEKNHGYGLQISGHSGSGRLRVNLAVATSAYQNPEDPFLSQGFDIVPSNESTDRARAANVDYDLWRPEPSGSGATFSNLTLSLHHDRTDALYKSVAAFVSPDVESNSAGLRGQFGQVSWQAEFKRSRDNLDDLDSVLTTVTESKALNLSIPLQYLSGQPRAWLPQSLSYSAQQIHQFGDNLPTGFDPTTHIPDQVNTLHNTSLGWQFGNYSVGYTLSWSNQDNRQPGRAQADFRDINHGINLGLPFTPNFSANLTLGAVIAADREQNLKRYSDSGSISIDWRVGRHVSLSSNYSLTRGSDSEDFTESNSYSLQTQITVQFELPGFGKKKIPGQIFIRHALNDNYSLDNQFQFESEGRTRSVNGGFNLSWY